MPSASIRLFNPFNLQHGSDQEWHKKLQEVIYYGDSRFRQALADINRSDSRHHLWMQSCLKDELVCDSFLNSIKDCLIMSFQLFIMSYVGIATSLGLVVEVPMVLRSLSISLVAVPDADLPIPFDLGLIAMLDSGTNDSDFGRIVKSYALPWWKGTRRPAEGGTLSAKTLEKCLEQHRPGLLETMGGEQMPEHPIIPIPSLQLQFGAEATVGADCGTAIATDDCPRCTVYKSLASDLLDELKSIKNFASGMVGTTCNETELIPRRALGFYSLHEKVLTKELISESHPVTVKHSNPGTKKGKMSLQVSLDADEELKRLRAVPTGSHKWTWGETLTQDEVRSLRHVSKKRVRSGYDTTLRPGNLDGEWSSQDSAPTTTGTKNHSLLSAGPHRPPPPTSLNYPEKFSSSNLQATVSGADREADIGAEILNGDAALAQSAASKILSAGPHPPPPSLNYPEKLSSSNLQATVSGAEREADIGAEILNGDAALAQSAASEIPPIPQPPTIFPHSVADKWINMESDDEAEQPSPSSPSISPDVAVSQKRINVERDEESQPMSPIQQSSKLGIADRWINMASDDESEPLPDSPIVTLVADKWINMDSDHEAIRLSPSSVHQSPPMPSKQDVGQRWIDMVSDDDRERTSSPMQQYLSQFGVANKWINMESDEEDITQQSPSKSGVAEKWINMASNEEIVGADGGADAVDHDDADGRTNDGSNCDEDENDEDADEDDEDEDADEDDEDEDADEDNDDEDADEDNEDEDADEDNEDEDADADEDDEDEDADADEDDEDEDADADEDDQPSAGSSHGPNLTATPSRINLTPRKFHSAEFDMLPIQLFDLDLQMKIAEAEENGD